MKRKSLLFLLLMALFAPLGMNGQQTLTVYDGQGTSSYVPMYGNWFDSYTKSEVIIPASQLTQMNGGTITAITFYAQSIGSHSDTWTGTNQRVFLKEVSSTSLGGSYSGTSGATIVKEGLLTMPTTSTSGYTITFSSPYVYQGGNLLIGVYNTSPGTYNSVSWYGQTGQGDGVSAYGYNSSSLNNVSYASTNFIPKTTFTYSMGPTWTGTSTSNYYISNFNVSDGSSTLLDNTTTGTIHTNNDYYNTKSITAKPGDQLTCVITCGASGTYGYAVWVDFDGDGLESSDKMFGTSSYQNSPYTGHFTIPANTPDGEYRLRVLADYNKSTPDDPNGTYSNGESEDYKLIVATPPCNAPIISGVNNITNNSASVSWTGTNDSYIVQYTDPSTATTSTQTLLSEGFESGSLPNGWSTSSSSGSYSWSIGTGTYYLTSAATGSYNAKFVAGTYSSDVYSYIITPTLDLGNATSATLTFKYANPYYSSNYNEDIDEFGVYYRVNGGAWNELFYTSALHNSWTSSSITLVGLAANYEIGFYAKTNYGGGVGVDDVLITAVVPEYTWTTASSNATSPYTLGNLTDDTEYMVRVIGVCNGIQSDPSNVVNFTTLFVAQIHEIYNDDDWNQFALSVRNGHDYSGETVHLRANISITSQSNQAGSNGNLFKGTFDGHGNTINVNMTATGSYCAPFYGIQNANINNLVVTGSISSEYQGVGGVCAILNGTSTFTNCVSNVAITSTCNNTAGDDTGRSTCGGFVAVSGGGDNPTFVGCAFTGSLTASRNGCGGFVGFHASRSGWDGNYGGVSTYTNCFCAPSSINVSGESAVFSCGYNAGRYINYTINNCYYNEEAVKLSYKKGTRVYTVTSGTDVTMSMNGTPSTTYDVSCLNFYSPGFTLTTGGNTTIYGASGNNMRLNLTCANVGEGGVVTYNATYGSSSTATLTGSENPYTLTMPNENVVIAANISFTKVIGAYGNSERGGYYFIASPVGTEVTPTADNGFLSGTYDLYYFDQNAWDMVDNENVLHEWRNYDVENFSIASGKGYLYANKEGTTLTFTGTPYSGNGEVTLSKTEGPRFSGWNLVGNPFAQTAYFTNDFYTLNEDRDEVVAGETKSVEAMEGIFVVAANDGETMTFSTTSLGKSNSQMSINVVRNRGNVIDRAIVRFDEESLLPKFQLNPNHTKIYIPQDGSDYAVVYADGAGTMPVNFKAEENGHYTLNFTTENVNFNYLHLIDNRNGNDVDLLQTPYYTFDAKSTDYASRFTLVFATGSSTGSDTFAFFNNGNWIINNDSEATLQIVDVTGRILSSESISGSTSKAINVAPGVYMLRLINGDKVKVQKIVVKR